MSAPAQVYCSRATGTISLEEIAGHIRHGYLDDLEVCVSHEITSEEFYMDLKGRLKDLGLRLPTGRIRRSERPVPREEVKMLL